MLKIIAILLNITFFIWILYMSIEYDFGGMEISDILIILMFFLFPIINIIVINDKDNWVNLYFKRKIIEEKRKTIEEKRKIAEIENKIE